MKKLIAEVVSPVSLLEPQNEVKETIIAICLYYGGCLIDKAKKIADELCSIFPKLTSREVV